MERRESASWDIAGIAFDLFMTAMIIAIAVMLSVFFIKPSKPPPCDCSAVKPFDPSVLINRIATLEAKLEAQRKNHADEITRHDIEMTDFRRRFVEVKWQLDAAAKNEKRLLSSEAAHLKRIELLEQKTVRECGCRLVFIPCPCCRR